MLRRFFDIAVSSAVLLVTAPVLGLAAALVCADGGPILYRQARAGLRGRKFTVFKLRSMRPNKLTTAEIALQGEVDSSHPQVTVVGQIIRRFKVDELPQLLNVLWGDMALIGPRPTILEQLDEYAPYQFRRLEIRPGLSGWAQVNGGIELTWPERILLDVWYVDHRSMWLDLKILRRTLAVVIFGEKRDTSALRVAEEYARRKLGTQVLEWPQETAAASRH